MSLVRWILLTVVAVVAMMSGPRSPSAAASSTVVEAHVAIKIARLSSTAKWEKSKGVATIDSVGVEGDLDDDDVDTDLHSPSHDIGIVTELVFNHAPPQALRIDLVTSRLAYEQRFARGPPAV